jgi:mannosyl-3-phosphoglycerate phosphatase
MCGGAPYPAAPSRMHILFTDLDGTLLDHDSYAWEPARPALNYLNQQGIPWMIVTSKTRAEVELWRERLDNVHPFVVENGAAAFVPEGYFAAEIVEGMARRDQYRVLEWGSRCEELSLALDEAAREHDCSVRAFHHMSAEDVAEACALPTEQAILAKRREYDEPFWILDSAKSGRLLAALELRGLHWTRGGRCYHVCGDNDKSAAVRALTGMFRKAYGDVTSIGLGDSPNDAGFLSLVDLPVLVRSAFSGALKRRVPAGVLTDQPGPRGWNAAVLGMLAG